ncbi:MAG: hypothetical protein COT26_02275 [Candidatus Kerfeldbacteria bacterium CG08_land_8_20_14_0_20_43_14]|uniref:Uncharacterized protein n=1 Tax=Candidatus Kerfeldbacteria bacterium CG08_land_8_20_14_0_20_43_14 TaxID=2014246 RepID=A0A2H0YQD9_9BACT|nr:MAG: hypothetical protein COT26_02275 [Candidatus Kerfeldbacteria bacterium CG08_land_8_20_14_0_20_43_14]
MLNQPNPWRDGVARCARYAFGPNKLHMCGPDANREVLSYIKEGVTDSGLTHILQKFQTLYPYLRSIAQANNIKDPFNDRVVEAYWLGNELLETVSKNQFYKHLTDNLELKRKSTPKNFDELIQKLPQGARMHHSFHVFNVYKRTGHLEILHTLESMDACRISWGKVEKIDGPKVTLKRKPLKLINQKLELAPEENFVLHRRLEEDNTLDELKIGDLVTLHWYQACEIVQSKDIKWLDFYTNKHLQLANLTI